MTHIPIGIDRITVLKALKIEPDMIYNDTKNTENFWLLFNDTNN